MMRALVSVSPDWNVRSQPDRERNVRLRLLLFYLFNQPVWRFTANHNRVKKTLISLPLFFFHRRFTPLSVRNWTISPWWTSIMVTSVLISCARLCSRNKGITWMVNIWNDLHDSLGGMTMPRLSNRRRVSIVLCRIASFKWGSVLAQGSRVWPLAKRISAPLSSKNCTISVERLPDGTALSIGDIPVGGYNKVCPELK